MGQIAFDLPADLSPAHRDAVERVWLAGGYDGTPVPSRRHRANGRLTLTRAENESVLASAPWPGSDGFERVVTSGTLRLARDAYPLLTELARGSVNRVRSLLAMFHTVGLPVPQSLTDAVGRVSKQFGRVALKTETDTTTACEVIDAACELADNCASRLTEYRLQARLNMDGPLPTRLGSLVSRPLPDDQAALFADTFHCVRIVPHWRQIEARESTFDWSVLDALVEWAASADLEVSIGPLVDLADGPFPDWLAASTGDLPNLAAYMSEFVGTVVQRYRREVRQWQAFAGFNQADALGLGEDERIRLAARVLEAVTEADPKGERTFAIAQPWGEYMSSEDHTYSPLVFADTLLRAGFNVTALELEVLTGAGRRSGFGRDPLDVLQLFEQYGQLGLPLDVTLGTPVPAVLPTVLGAPSVRAVYADTWSTTDPAGRVPRLALVGADGAAERLAQVQAARREWLRGPAAAGITPSPDAANR
jgi:hypothetical protein